MFSADQHNYYITLTRDLEEQTDIYNDLRSFYASQFHEFPLQFQDSKAFALYLNQTFGVVGDEILQAFKRHDLEMLLRHIEGFGFEGTDRFKHARGMIRLLHRQIATFKAQYQQHLSPVITFMEHNSRIEVVKVTTSWKSISTYVTFRYQGQMPTFQDDFELFQFNPDKIVEYLKADHILTARMSDHRSLRYGPWFYVKGDISYTF